ncbi:hypothetical protein [Photobacterium damselae]|uniref:hypothetical protein n=1 Tax=Photobacterium damselae TaxID=38293 RepID=UPI001F324995|nr:hypothetical protein [Photobacterium damselae]UKA04958.1 hypothetical protein IHC89_22190 [Photobacterium damselae subsp. damselae]
MTTVNKTDRKTVKRLVKILESDHKNLPLSDAALSEIKNNLMKEYSVEIVDAAIYTFTHAIFYKNSIVKNTHKHSITGEKTQLISPEEKKEIKEELDFIKNEAYKIVKQLRKEKIKTPLSSKAIFELQRRLIVVDGFKPKIAKKAIYSFTNSISYQASILKDSNTHFFDLDGNVSQEMITDAHIETAKRKYSHFNSIHNPRK